MEHGAPIHWGCIMAASLILSCMSMVSWDTLTAARIYRRLAKAAASYTLSLSPVAVLVYALYVVSGGF